MRRQAEQIGPIALISVGVGLLAYRVASDWSLGGGGGGTVVPGFDFKLVWAAGRALTDGRSLYAVQIHGHPFGYPPSAALLLGAPFSHLAFGTVSHVVGIAEAASLVGAVFLAARTVGRSWRSLASAAGVALVSVMGIATEGLGLENVSLLVALLGAGAFLAWSRDQEVLCGVLFGLSIAVKPLLVPLCIGLVLLRRWRLLGVAAAVVAGLNLVALAVDPAALRGLSGFLADLFGDRGALSGYFFVFNSAVVSTGHLFGWPEWLTTTLRALEAAAAGAAAAGIWRARPEPARSLEAGGLLLAGFYLASSDLEAHWLLVLIPFAFAAVVPGSPLRWWPAAVGGLFASDLVVLPQGLTHYGYFGTETVGITFGLTLVVLATLVATVTLNVDAAERGRRRDVPSCSS